MLEFKRTDHQIDFKANYDQKGYFEGYASIYDEIDQHNDRVIRGAFNESIACWKTSKKMPKMLWQHNQEYVLGVWTSIEEDQKGLLVRGRLLLELEKAREAYTLMQAQAIDGLSIGYNVKQSIKGNNDSFVRLLTAVDLIEISLVTFPANNKARISSVKQQ